jgi:uncharacterized phage-associated protein
MPQLQTKPLNKEYSAEDVANCLIEIADERVLGHGPDGKDIKEGITNLKLQKMLYFADAVYLAFFGKALFKDEIQAWDLGPVVPTVYKIFSKFGDQPIHAESVADCLDPDLHEFLREVWNTFGKYSATELVNISHMHAPWKNNYKQDKKNVAIPKEEIAQFYRSLFKINNEQ